MQIIEAKQRLRHAVDTVDVGLVPILKKALAKACIQHGLQPMAGAFHVTPVTLAALGSDGEFQPAQLARELPPTRLKRVLEQPQLKHIFSLGHNSHNIDTIQLHFARLMPQASLHVRSLLPSEAWPQLSNGVNTAAGDFPGSDSSTGSDMAVDDLESDSSSSDTTYEYLQSEAVQSMLLLLPPPIREAAEAEMRRQQHFDSSR